MLHVESRAGHLDRGCLEYPQKKHLLLTDADVAGASFARKSSLAVFDSMVAAMTDDPQGTAYNSEFLWAASRARVWSNMVVRSRVELLFSSRR